MPTLQALTEQCANGHPDCSAFTSGICSIKCRSCTGPLIGSELDARLCGNCNTREVAS